jgi:hypothetical protein
MLSTLFTTLFRCLQAFPRNAGNRPTDRKVSAQGLVHDVDVLEGRETRTRKWWRGRRLQASAPALPSEKISCPAKRFPNPARGGMGAPAFSRAKNRTRHASSAVTSTTFVVTASTCLAFRSGGGCRRIVQGCVGREAGDATLTTMTAGPDRCDRDSLLQKTSACFISGPAVQGTEWPWRFCLLPDPTLAKANCKSKSIKVSGLNNVLANHMLGSCHSPNGAKKNLGRSGGGRPSHPAGR